MESFSKILNIFNKSRYWQWTDYTFDIRYVPACCLLDDEKQQIIELLETNMKEMYKVSEWRWNRKKKLKELCHKEAKHIIVENEEKKIVGFVHFQIDQEDSHKCVYCYEIQVAELVRNVGLGRFLIQLLHMVAVELNLPRIYCTVFKHNERSRAFFHRLAFRVSPHSPDDTDYDIFFKDRNHVCKRIRQGKRLHSQHQQVSPQPGKQAKMAEIASSGMSGVQHIIVVMSGKGGVGKSSVTALLARALHDQGKKVGVLDVDLCGPSLPHIFHVSNRTVHQSDSGWVPIAIESSSLHVMSIGFLTDNKDDAIVWRGPKKNAVIKQFVGDVCWGELDYLIIDTPPGTSDEHISVLENILKYKPDGAILVTTPQALSVGDVRREVTFCKKTKLPILGIIENMSGYVCPHCQECTNIFSKGGGKALAEYSSVPFLGELPIDSAYNEYLDTDSQPLTDLQCDLLDKMKDIIQALL